MSTSVDSANLILKLYETRREEKMRQARDFMFGFDPQSFADIQAVFMGPNSGHFRMVVTYWDMACSFVLSGAIDAKMFDDANGEHIIAFAKIEPFLEQIREMLGSPNYARNLEGVCKAAPGGLERVAATRERIRGLVALMRASQAQAAAA